ncbi:cytochrome P450 [Peniophora sp. CONT]|nr:cytochrome P450 [Peniophora sp. CONT]
MPTQQEWLKVTQWAKELGPVFMINVLGRNVVFANTVEAARDLLSDRWQNYSERPRLVLVKEMMGLGFAFTFQSMSEPTYGLFRRIFVREFSHQAIGTYEGILDQENKACLMRCLEDPSNFEQYLHNQVTFTVMAIAYGRSGLKADDVHVQAAEAAMRTAAEAMRPANYLPVESFPFLRHIPAWFPGAHFRRVALHGHRLVQQARFGTWDWALEQYAQGKTQPSFFTRLMGMYNSGAADINTVRDCCSVLHAVATDTTMSSLMTFVLAMLYAPEVQVKAQTELDGITGGSRLPTLSDRKHTPYIDAMVKEVLRWGSVIPLGLPHVTRADDVYNDMFIPAGTTVMPNQYGMSRDESYYPDPMIFKPERFLGENRQHDPSTIAFGFGARICPGRHLAQLIIWLNIATILSCFDIKRPTDSTGSEFIPPFVYTSGLTSRPDSVPCRLIARPGWSAVIRNNAM